MTLARKLATGAALVVVAGVALYQAKENRRLRHEIQALQLHVGTLEERNTALESDLNLATNRLLGVLSSVQSQTTELLRLRGEVGGLKRAAQEQSMARGREQPRTPPEANEATLTEADLDAEQQEFLTEMTKNVATKNSVADISRLKDSLVRWDELFAGNTNMFPGKMQAVLPILKQRVIERVAELEAEAAKDASGQTR